jgi:hypothetical protein
MRIELNDGEMLELADYEARLLYETLLERARARRALSAAAKLRPALAWLSGSGTKVALDHSRLQPCRQSARTSERGEPFTEEDESPFVGLLKVEAAQGLVSARVPRLGDSTRSARCRAASGDRRLASESMRPG